MSSKSDKKEQMDVISHYAKLVIPVLQSSIEHMGYTPVLHFELEGTYTPKSGDNISHSLDFERINAELDAHNIQGILKPEFWPCQWEWASKFEGQNPMKATKDLDTAIDIIPSILEKYGAENVFIKPVMWSGAEGNKAILSANQSPVHIPNSIQANISALNKENKNIISENGFGEQLQECLLRTSYECCILYAPEEEAFDRFSLKEKYNLSEEPNSPYDISGGNQGSIALYRERGKHNQKISDTAESRIEHRLGSSSKHYNPYVNTVFLLANLSDAIMLNTHNSTLKLDSNIHSSLPTSLLGEGNSAYNLLANSSWFEEKVNACVEHVKTDNLMPVDDLPKNIGTLLKEAVLDYY